ncbi:MFS transporter [Acinetobacter puyangensis]|uniref:Predicted arabinose efflux permease, MFS family n=1 Tax=Acinetobacter puyangensis TaxID=1096779 RepID=A0A240ECA9_9GAMM|nr:MFS transporter [Acinetobacter puyangensis]SNX45550.1 Predicted arabinose efflux permease, MFS family [Acinetobacter puyangensis]
MNENRLWSRDFILTSLINFMMVLVFYMLVVVIAGYAVTALHASKAEAGLISGLFIVGTLIGRFMIGQFTHILGRQKTLWLGLTGFSISAGLYFIASSSDFLLAVRFIHGFSFGLASSILGAIIAQIIPVTRRGEGIGYYSLSSTLGTAVGPLLGIYLTLHASYQWIFSLSMIIALICLGISFLIKIPALPEKNLDLNEAIKKPSFLQNFIEVKAVPIAIVVFIASICYSSVLSFINFYAQELQLEKSAALFFLVYSIAILASRPFTGKLMDQKGENVVMYPALFILALALLLLSVVQQGSLLLICGALLGLGFGNMQSIAQAIAVKSTSLERMGLATSTFFIALDAGLGFGPFILGFVLNHISYAQMYFYSAWIALACIALYFVLHGRHARVKAIQV